jgi:hypothetical protein
MKGKMRMRKYALLVPLLAVLLMTRAALAADLSGTVYHADGTTAITGSSIAVEIFQGEPCAGYDYIAGTFTDSATGTYNIVDIPDGTYILRTWPAGSNYVGEWWSSGASTLDCSLAERIDVTAGGIYVDYNFQLEIGGIITGIVRDIATGSAITGESVSVNVHQGDPCGMNHYIGGVWSDPDTGQYTITGIPAGDFVLRATQADSDYVDAWWSESGGIFDCNGADLVTFENGVTLNDYDFLLQLGGYLSGTVTHSDGHPIAGVWMQAFSGPCWENWSGGAVTDESGVYTIGPVPGGTVDATDYYVHACPTCNGLDYADAWWESLGPVIDCNSAEAVGVIARDTHTDIDFTLATSGSITGRVMSGGEPVSGLWVEVFSDKCWAEGSWLNGGSTDENGYYTVYGLPVGDVYVHTCAGCDNRNYIDRWYTQTGGSENCNQAEAVAVAESSTTGSVDFDLEKGPRRERWTEVSVYDGVLGAGFDLQPGFDNLIVSATLVDPNGNLHQFDIETDTFQWLTECYYNQTMWWLDLNQPILYGEYQLTLRFRDGYEKTYVHNVQDITIFPVNAAAMSYSVNADGSIDFTFANPDPDPANPSQWHRIMIYQGSDRILSYHVQPKNTSVYNVHVTANDLRCLQIGESYEWHVRAHDLNDPYNITHRTHGTSLLDYLPTGLDNRATSFSATHALSEGELWLYFNTRPGSRDTITSASVNGPGGFQYDFDLIEDWFDLSTETRTLNGWFKADHPPRFGVFTFNIMFADGHEETRTFELPDVTVVPVDVNTIQVYILENGAGYVTWELPVGVTGQYYQVRIRSADGSKEYFASNPSLDSTSQYVSPNEMRAMVHGGTYQLFIRAYDANYTTMAQSESVVEVHDPFELFPKPDVDKDWDVDGADLAEIVQMILDGEIDNLAEAMPVIAGAFGRVY